MNSKEEKGAASPSQLIDAKMKELGDWRGEALARVRSLIKLQSTLQRVSMPRGCPGQARA